MVKPALVCLLGLCIATSGCTSTRSIPLPPATGQAVPRINPGDRLVVTMMSGAVHHLRLEAIDSQTLTGRNVEGSKRGTSSQLALADIQQLQVRRVLVGRTAGVISAVVLAGIVVGGVHCFSDGRTFCARED